MKRRGRILVKVLKLKAMGFLCGVGLFVAAFALAGGDAVMSQWDVEHVIIPLTVAIISAAAWYIRQIERRLSELNKEVAKQFLRMGQRLSHIEGKLGVSQSGGNDD